MVIELDKKKEYRVKEVEHNIDKWIHIIQDKRQKRD